VQEPQTDEKDKEEKTQSSQINTGEQGGQEEGPKASRLKKKGSHDAKSSFTDGAEKTTQEMAQADQRLLGQEKESLQGCKSRSDKGP
jgi:hypothetical protein